MKRSRKSTTKSSVNEETVNDTENGFASEQEQENRKSLKRKSRPKDKLEKSDGYDQKEISPKKSKKGKSVENENAASDESEKEDEENYEVEAVLDDKKIDGVKHYLIRWKGYDSKSDSWEPVSTLNCRELIAEYKTKAEKMKNEKKKQKKAAESQVTWDENEKFEVNRILEVHFKNNGKREFLVSWKGYPSSDNSWEPEENMDCKELIDKFMAKVEQAKVYDTKELRPHRAVPDRLTFVMYEGKGRRASKRNKGSQRVHYYDAE